MKHNHVAGIIIIITLLVLFFGCSNDSLAPFQPEIGNSQDNFQFQATGITNVTTTLNYLWQNSGSRASINQSSAVTSGTAILTLYDPNNVQRYSRSLSENGTFQSDTGVAGTWKINVVLTNLSGTLNFRCQKL